MTRDTSIDIAKGIAIIAIVLGHVLRGLNSAGMIVDEVAFTRWDNALYSWHLTTFAFLSGLFVARSSEKSGTSAYLRSRIGNFLWVYVLWSLIQGIVKIAAAGSVNSQTSPLDILAIWRPEGQLWFFPWIIVATILATMIRPWIRPHGFITIACSAVVAVGLWGYSGPVIGLQGLALYVFYFAGTIMQADTYQRMKIRWYLTLGAAAFYATLIAAVSFTPPTTGFENRDVMTVAAGLLTTAAGVTLVLGVSKTLAPVRQTLWLSILGRRSLEIFTAHILFTAGARIILSKFGLHFLSVQVLAGVMFGLVGPLVLVWIMQRWTPAKLLFMAPRAITHKSEHGLLTQ
ncbi:acyltransferase family protein [Acidipropionibacterium jensenii]|uniref:acyltransferase family protein n=1 Tax=Acidipropionibacterium jensenii TaxID=1749 RepID=UPI0015868005|nr:acyltransferase [Acidipropionibacterium jensenii]